MSALIERIAEELNVSEQLLLNAVKYGQTRFKQFDIDKRSGGKRQIFQPSNDAKLLQYWFMQNVFARLPIHSIAMAFRDGVSIVDNAKAHRAGHYAVRIDFSDFFWSIRSTDLTTLLSKHAMDDMAWISDRDTTDVIEKICFERNFRLPIGYPSSPVISNLVMYHLDEEIVAAINNTEEFGNCAVTRYADDIVFSTDKAGACESFVGVVTKLVAKTRRPSLQINAKKTRYMSRGGGSMIITGIRVCHDGHLTLHKSYKSNVEMMLYTLKLGKLANDRKEELRGHLSFVKSVDSRFLTKLSFSYADEIEALTAKHLPA